MPLFLIKLIKTTELSKRKRKNDSKMDLKVKEKRLKALNIKHSST